MRPVIHHHSRQHPEDLKPDSHEVTPPVTDHEMSDALGEEAEQQQQRRRGRGLLDRRALSLAGYSPVMRGLRAEIKRLADTADLIHLRGEPGTGKLAVARAIHETGRRREERFLVIECGAGLGELLSRAGRNEAGRPRERALEAGTVYLRHVDALSPAAQSALLRFLDQERAEDGRPARIGIIASTRSRLETSVHRGAFRPDLFFRLSAVALRLPPLRERREDIPLLVNTLLRLSGQAPRVSPVAWRALLRYEWPDNVRELRQAVESALKRDEDQLLGPEDLPPPLGAPDDFGWLQTFLARQASLSEVERLYVLTAYDFFGREFKKTASALGIDRRTLGRKLRAYGLLERAREQHWGVSTAE